MGSFATTKGLCSSRLRTDGTGSVPRPQRTWHGPVFVPSGSRDCSDLMTSSPLSRLPFILTSHSNETDELYTAMSLSCPRLLPTFRTVSGGTLSTEWMTPKMNEHRATEHSWTQHSKARTVSTVPPVSAPEGRPGHDRPRLPPLSSIEVGLPCYDTPIPSQRQHRTRLLQSLSPYITNAYHPYLEVSSLQRDHSRPFERERARPFFPPRPTSLLALAEWRNRQDRAGEYGIAHTSQEGSSNEREASGQKRRTSVSCTPKCSVSRRDRMVEIVQCC